MYTVYLVENTLNHKLYVGITKFSVKKRWNQHCSNSENSGYAFHNAIQKHGKENFDLVVLSDTSSEKEALRLEKHYISKFKTYEFGYNSTRGGKGYLSGQRHPLVDWSDKEVIKIVNEYRSTDKTIEEVSQKWEVNKGTLSSWHNGSSRSHLQSDFVDGKIYNYKSCSDKKAVKAMVDYKRNNLNQKETAIKHDIKPVTFNAWLNGQSRCHLREKVTARLSYKCM